MAEIKVERKKKSSILPWILGLALLALVVWGLSQMGDRDENRVESQGAALQSIELSAPITFVDFVDALSVRGVRAA